MKISYWYSDYWLLDSSVKVGKRVTGYWYTTDPSVRVSTSDSSIAKVDSVEVFGSEGDVVQCIITGVSAGDVTISFIKSDGSVAGSVSLTVIPSTTS